MKSCNKNIEKAIKMAEAMIELADEGDMAREDIGCGILYGILRDSAYRIKKAAEAEKASHILRGVWK